MVFEFSETAYGINLWTKSPIRALDLLGRHQGLWNDKTELSGTVAPFAHLSDHELKSQLDDTAARLGYLRAKPAALTRPEPRTAGPSPELCRGSPVGAEGP